jgi:hypothetical protein
MRTNARSLPAAALFLAASAATISGCQPAPQPEALRPPGGVTAIVTYDENTKKAVMLDLGPEKKITLRKNKDWAVWVSPAGLVYVTFTAESPFDSPPKHEKKVLKSGPAKKKGSFAYTAELELWGGGARLTIDPRIEVVD